MTEQAGHALFETAIGRCGLAWNDVGVTRVSLPPASEAQLRAKGEPAEPPAEIAAVIGDIVALLAGEPRDLTHVRLDMTGVTEFNRRALAAARTIPPGETATYGEIATRLGEPGAAAPTARPRAPIPARSSSPATAASAPTARSAAFPRRAGRRPRSACWPSNAPGSAVNPTSSATCPWPSSRRRRIDSRRVSCAYLATRMSILPVLAPRKRPMRPSGARSNPSRMVSSKRRLPSLSQPVISATKA